MLKREKERAKSYGDSATKITMKHQAINDALAEIIEAASK